MKRALLIAACTACGHAARTPAPVLANKPQPAPDAAPETEAAASEDDAQPDGEAPAPDDDAFQPTCDHDASQDVIVAGKDAHVSLRLCTTGEEHVGGDPDSGFVTKDRTATLVLDRAEGDPLELEIASWQDGWEDGTKFTIVGVLKARARGDGAVLVQADSWGPADGLDGVGAQLGMYAVVNGEWKEVHRLSASVIDVSMSKDQRVATIGTCDPPKGAQGTGGGGCEGGGAASYDGDGHTVELRWQGGHAIERAVAP